MLTRYYQENKQRCANPFRCNYWDHSSQTASSGDGTPGSLFLSYRHGCIYKMSCYMERAQVLCLPGGTRQMKANDFSSVKIVNTSYTDIKRGTEGLHAAINNLLESLMKQEPLSPQSFISIAPFGWYLSEPLMNGTSQFTIQTSMLRFPHYSYSFQYYKTDWRHTTGPRSVSHGH